MLATEPENRAIFTQLCSPCALRRPFAAGCLFANFARFSHDFSILLFFLLFRDHCFCIGDVDPLGA